MLKNTIKGSTLIMSVMIVTVLMIMASGFFVMSNSTSQIQKNLIEKQKIYWAAESGINFATKYLRNVSKGDRLDYNYGNKTFSKNVTNMLAVKNISVNINGYKTENPNNANEAIWHLKAVAVNSKSGKKCTISMDNITGTPSILRYAQANLDQSENSGYYSVGYDYFGSFYNKNRIMILWKEKFGQYFGPKYYKTFFSGSNKKTIIRYNSKLNFDNYNSPYAHGIIDITSGVWGQGIKETEKRFGSSFLGGYNQKTLKADVDNAVESWSEITKSPKTYVLKTSDVPKNRDTKIKLVVKDNKTYAYLYSKYSKFNYKKAILISGQYNGIAIPSKFKNIYVEGVSNTDLTIATESDNIYISGDFTTSDLEKYKNVKNSAIDINAMKFASDAIGKSKIRLGLIAGVSSKADFLIQNNYSNYSNVDNNTICLVTAGLLTKYGTIKRVGPAWWKNFVRLVIAGSLIVKQEGGTSYGNRGFAPNPVEDPRFVYKSQTPPFFNHIRNEDPYTHIWEGAITSYNWTISWK